jgi:hypothetical protein
MMIDQWMLTNFVLCQFPELAFTYSIPKMTLYDCAPFEVL